MPIAIVLPLPADVAARVALSASVSGALPVSDLHLTLAVLTSAPPDLFTVAATLAAQAAPIVATLSGVGRFSTPDGDAFHLTVDGPSLGALRAAIENTEALRGSIDRTHGFDPHVTLAYLPPDAPAPLPRIDPIPLVFGTLAVWWDNDTRRSFMLGPSPQTVASLDALELPQTPPNELRLFREGWNDTTKGRFLLDAGGAAEAVARFRAHGVDLAMDFDHSTFTQGGARRDVPGYISDLAYRSGDGLYATGIRWTDVGLRAITPGRAPDGSATLPEYRYFSPSIDFEPDTRRIVGIKPVALVTWPATMNQTPLVLTASANTTETRPMSMKNIALMLGLTDSASEADVLSAATSTRDNLGSVLSALGARDVPSALGTITALRTAREQLDAVQKDNTDLRGRVDAVERDGLVARGRREGKLTPALEKLYADKPVAELKAYLEAAPVIPALVQSPTRQPVPGQTPDTAGVPQKPFEQLSALEKDQLFRGNRIAFEQSLAAFESRGGDGARYRSMLSR